jgi:glyoxylase-like metal-dependent hydrolase (beta-lactamase superfamily II)
MDNIEIPKGEIVPMDAVAPGIEGLRIIFVNVFSVQHGNGSWTLIDAGLPYSAGAIRGWAEKRFSHPPNAIVLTHGHFDHVGAAHTLAERWNVPIYAHPLERPYLTGEREYPKPNFAAGGGLMSLLSPMMPRGPFDLRAWLRDLPEGTGTARLAEMPEWDIIHTPGHTAGHFSLFRAADRMLLAGDAFCTTKPESFFGAAIAQKPELHGPPAYFTSDWTLARQSVEALTSLAPETVAPGHGQAMRGANIPSLLNELVARFDQLAVPENRRGTAA